MTHEVSDDEIWSGLRRRFAVGASVVARRGRRHAPDPRERVAVKRSARLRTAGAGSIIGVGVVIVLVAALVGSLSGRPGPTPLSSGTAPASAAAPSATPGSSPALTLSAQDAGVSLTASLDRTTVEPGGTVAITVSVHNGRTIPAGYYADCPGSTIMTTSLPLPLEPVGQSWTGDKAAFKVAALGGGKTTGESDTSIGSEVYSVTCQPSENVFHILRPGESIESHLTWSATLVKGVPALPGDVPFTITIMGPAGYPPVLPTRPPGVNPGSFFVGPDQSMVHVSGHIEIVGQAPKLLSKGQVIDAALANPQFARWLAEEPSKTWSTINVVLQNDGTPASWLIEVFREHGVPRNLALAYIDAYTGALRMDICESPCPR